MLPGIGERTALRLALYLLEQKKERIFSLAESLVEIANNVAECDICCNLTAFSRICSICQTKNRDQSIICVVSTIQDLMAVEASNGFKGYYHVLHGVMEPINGIGPDKLRIRKFLDRLKIDNFIEVILATPSSIEGEATAIYLKDQIGKKELLKITRIACGIPVGGDLQYADRLSLSRALSLRQIY